MEILHNQLQIRSNLFSKSTFIQLDYYNVVLVRCMAIAMAKQFLSSAISVKMFNQFTVKIL